MQTQGLTETFHLSVPDRAPFLGGSSQHQPLLCSSAARVSLPPLSQLTVSSLEPFASSSVDQPVGNKAIVFIFIHKFI